MIKDKANENTLNAFEYLEQDQVRSSEIEEESTISDPMPLLPALAEISSKRRDRSKYSLILFLVIQDSTDKTVSASQPRDRRFEPYNGNYHVVLNQTRTDGF